MVVTQEEFDNWLESPVTKALKDQIKRDIQRMQDMLIDVDFDNLRELQGRIKASVNLLTVSREDLYE